MEKVRDCQLFMTTTDEKMFCKALRVFNPNIYFLDVKPSFESCIDERLVTDVTRLDSDIFSIVNLDMITKEELSKCYKIRSGYYHFFQLGRAQMQFLRSAPDRNVEGCLQHGRIADSYKIVDKEERAWKNKVYAILKKIGQKVYWYYTLPDGTREISTKPENNLVAFPDAAVNYNGKSGNFMIHNRAKFVPQSIAVSELNDNPDLAGV
ncbi:MAG: hypothetical protein ACFNM7_06335 [Prevotella conceptionensis]